MKFKLLFPLIGVITLTAFVVAFVLWVWLMTIKRTQIVQAAYGIKVDIIKPKKKGWAR